jgi:hypothetical protein
MGIRPLPEADAIETHPQLTRETGWAALKHLPVGNHVISVRHESQATTALSNESGPDLFWRASFPGKTDVLFVDGTQVPAETGVRLGGDTAVSYSVKVRSGQKCIASIHSG